MARDGAIFVTLSGLGPDGRPGTGSVMQIAPEPKILCDGLRAPVTGLTLHDDVLYISEGGRPGRISAIERRRFASDV